MGGYRMSDEEALEELRPFLRGDWTEVKCLYPRQLPEALRVEGKRHRVHERSLFEDPTSKPHHCRGFQHLERRDIVVAKYDDDENLVSLVLHEMG